jgi:TRAP transporter 4TM/12TM fusion protein
MAKEETEIKKNGVEEILEKYEVSAKRRKLKGFEKYLIKIIAILFSLFQFYTMGFKMLPPQIQRPIHVGFAFLLIYLLVPSNKKEKRDKIPFYDYIIAILIIFIFLYPIIFYQQLIGRAGSPTNLDFIVGLLAVILILEGTRRIAGIPLPLISSIFILYALFGKYIPGLFAHRGYSIIRVVDHLFFTLDGIFGIPISVSTKFVYAFILFGALAERTGLGELFIDIARALTGRAIGGPAKVAIVSSGLLGTMSGSSVANVVTTGSFTIPLMKKTGYKPHFAGAVEATASTGGQLMPPVMGAAAFIMAEFIGVPYLRIILAAIMPSLLYYSGAFFAVHYEAKRLGLRGLKKEEIPDVLYLLKIKGYLLIPIFVLIFRLIAGYTVIDAAFTTLISTILVSFLGDLAKKLTENFDEKIKNLFLYISTYLPIILFLILIFYPTFKISAILSFIFTIILSLILGTIFYIIKSKKGFYEDFKDSFIKSYHVIKDTIYLTLDGFENGAITSLPVVAACATAGYIAGMSTLTGLALKFANAVVSMAKSGTEFYNKTIGSIFPFLKLNNAMLLTLMFTMIASLILGMGIPTTGTYILMAIITAPALSPFLTQYSQSISMLIAHMFVFYYGILADITPPVALAAYAGAGIAGSDPFKTGYTAVKLSLAGYLIPFIFAFNPILLGVNFTILNGILSFITAFIGIIFLAGSSIGYLSTNLNFIERIFFFISATLLITPGLKTDLIGIGIGGLFYLIQYFRYKKQKEEIDV